jgi:hypothetical protein
MPAPERVGLLLGLGCIVIGLGTMLLLLILSIRAYYGGDPCPL